MLCCAVLRRVLRLTRLLSTPMKVFLAKLYVQESASALQRNQTEMYKLPTYSVAKPGSSGGGSRTYTSQSYRRSKTKGSLFSKRNRLTLVFAALLAMSILFSALFMYRIQQSDREQDGYRAEDVEQIQAMPSPAFCNRVSISCDCSLYGVLCSMSGRCLMRSPFTCV